VIVACEHRDAPVDASRPDAKLERAASATRSERAPGPVEPRLHGTEGSPAIVWSADSEGRTTSRWVAEESPGRWTEIARPGIVIGGAGGIELWREEAVRIPLHLDCASYRTDRRVGWGDGVRAGLASASGDGFRTVVDPALARGREAAELQQRVVLEGSFGPYLFIHSVEWDYSCGAHGGSTHRFLVWDASRGREASLHRESEIELVTTELRARLGTAEPDGLELDMPAPASLSVTRFGPRFGDDGRASFFYQLTGDTCYACGDDAWDSYTRSLELPRDELPSALAAETLPRGAIAWLARTHPEEQIRGFGWARPEDRGAFEALPVR
jgi:hypothetical protein